MTREDFKLSLEIVAVGLTLAGIGIGIWQFKLESEESRRAAEELNTREFNRALWLDQYETYRDVSDTIGAIASAIETGNEDDRQKAVAKFSALYWGRAIFVENSDVAEQMIRFRKLMEQYDKGRLTDDQIKKAAARLSAVLKKAARSGEEAARVGAPVSPEEAVN